MFLLLDNYDSFTFNLYHYLCELGVAVEVLRNDATSVEDLLARRPEGIVISPGPGRPEDAGVTEPLIAAAAGRVPILGVCLGHQGIGHVFGGKVVRAETVMHGKTSSVHHEGTGLFAGLPSPFTATRYHSLILERASLPACLRITAESADDIVMGLEHTEHALYGVQFHPESIASEHGHALLKNFIGLAAPAAAA